MNYKNRFKFATSIVDMTKKRGQVEFVNICVVSYEIEKKRKMNILLR